MIWWMVVGGCLTGVFLYEMLVIQPKYKRHYFMRRKGAERYYKLVEPKVQKGGPDLESVFFFYTFEYDWKTEHLLYVQESFTNWRKRADAIDSLIERLLKIVDVVGNEIIMLNQERRALEPS